MQPVAMNKENIIFIASSFLMVILIVMWYNIIKIIFIGDVMYEGYFV